MSVVVCDVLRFCGLQLEAGAVCDGGPRFRGLSGGSVGGALRFRGLAARTGASAVLRTAAEDVFPGAGAVASSTAESLSSSSFSRSRTFAAGRRARDEARRDRAAARGEVSDGRVHAKRRARIRAVQIRRDVSAGAQTWTGEGKGALDRGVAQPARGRRAQLRQVVHAQVKTRKMSNHMMSLKPLATHL